MIKKANTDEDRDRCREYLRAQRLESPSDCFLFTENPDGVITGACGITIGICDNYKMGYVEPFYTDNNVTSLKLYCAAEGFLLGKGCKYSLVGCEENKINEKMYIELGYRQWSKNFNQYIKNIGE